MNKQYAELERQILSCVLQRPELMEKVKLEDKYFIQYKNLWKLLKAFYGRFKCLDIVMISSMVKPQYKFAMYMEDLLMIEPNPNRLEEYQNLLLELCEEEKQEKEKINKIYDLANDLIVRKMTTQEFKDKINKII